MPSLQPAEGKESWDKSQAAESDSESNAGETTLQDVVQWFQELTPELAPWLLLKFGPLSHVTPTGYEFMRHTFIRIYPMFFFCNFWKEQSNRQSCVPTEVPIVIS